MGVEMAGLIKNRVWDQTPRLADKLVLGTKMIFDGKTYAKGRGREVQVPFCREGVPLPGKASTDTSNVKHQDGAGDAVWEKRELRHVALNQAFIQANIGKEMYIELPMEY